MNRAAYAPYRHQSVGQKPEDVDVETVQRFVENGVMLTRAVHRVCGNLISRLRTAEAERDEARAGRKTTPSEVRALLARLHTAEAELAKMDSIDLDVLLNNLRTTFDAWVEASRSALKGEEA
jgi:hypothetical protein